MKRRGSWQINFIVRALTGMGSIFLVNQWMDYRNIPVSVGLNVLSFFVSGCLGIPGVAMLYGIMCYQFMEVLRKTFFSGLKLWTKGKVAHIIRLTREAKQ